ncbi:MULTISPECIES: hypothetical protein [Actinomadura]|uniref:Uncharacterized protein n=1 Tax=Actinomadura yumaensis TaxID=111807 RepID=A0ABW2CSE9_9ACTN|nr:hypothetical protein [Actinomadura sp. J1-007]MWK35072.1 hypothetical protein [Actinomadura sp. J1-007]
MLITGYEDDPLSDGSDLLNDPSFWAVHALTVGATGLDDLQGGFGVDIEDAEVLSEQLFDPDRWPVFSVRLRSRATVHVIYRNLTDDMGVDFLLSHPAWPHAFQLAAIDGCLVGPGLSWRELDAIAHQPPSSAPTSIGDPARRLLLLLPALGDADLPDDAVSVLTTALGRITASPVPQHVAEALLFKNAAYWEPAHWRRLPNSALICDEPHSRRCPAHPDAFPPDQALAITQALTGN